MMEVGVKWGGGHLGARGWERWGDGGWGGVRVGARWWCGCGWYGVQVRGQVGRGWWSGWNGGRGRGRGQVGVKMGCRV